MVNDYTIYDEIGIWPGFSVVVLIKVFSRFLAKSEVDFWCIHAWGKQTRQIDTA